MSYSDNLLTNPGAETGDLTGWSSASASVITGGTEGNYCFQVNDGGYIFQSVTPSQEPEDVRFSGSFLPEENLPSDEQDCNAYAVLTFSYSDGTEDVYYIPVMATS